MDLTDKQRVEIRTRVQVEIYRRSFFEFLHDAVRILEPQTQWDFNWHIYELCQIAQLEVERIAAGRPKEKDIIINVPPRTMKSYIFSICLNAWAWTHSPHLKFMTLSYSSSCFRISKL